MKFSSIRSAETQSTLTVYVTRFEKMTKIRRCRPSGGDPFDERNDCRVLCIYKSKIYWTRPKYTTGPLLSLRPVLVFHQFHRLANVVSTGDEPYLLLRELLNLAHALPAARGRFITRFIDTILRIFLKNYFLKVSFIFFSSGNFHGILIEGARINELSEFLFCTGTPIAIRRAAGSVRCCW